MIASARGRWSASVCLNSLITLLIFLAAARAQARSAYDPPPPPGGLPLPYAGADFRAKGPEQQAYARYLATTPLFPDLAVCERDLKEGLTGAVQGDSLSYSWKTLPYMAWGGRRRAEVGPVEHLVVLTEAHARFIDMSGEEQLLTYVCYVQYAPFADADVWSTGQLEYGSYMANGWRKYVSGPASDFGYALPGKPTKWDRSIRYYDGRD